MADTPKKDSEQPIPQMPFNEALKRMMNTPPKHKETKKQKKKSHE